MGSNNDKDTCCGGGSVWERLRNGGKQWEATTRRETLRAGVAMFGKQWDVLGNHGMFWVMVGGCFGMFWARMGCFGQERGVLGLNGMFWETLGYVEKEWQMLGKRGICLESIRILG